MKNHSFTFKIVRRLSLLLAVQATLAIVISYYLGSLFCQHFHLGAASIGGLWSAISAILVTQVAIDDSINAGWLRILGSLIGSITSLITNSIFGYSITSLIVCCLLTVMLVSLFKLKHTFRLACLTGVVIIIGGMFVNTHLSPIANSTARFTESAIGTLVTILLTIIIRPIRNKTGLTAKI